MTLTRFAAAAIRSLNPGPDRFKLHLQAEVRSKAEALLLALRSISYERQISKNATPPEDLDLDDNFLPEKEAAVHALQNFFFSAITDSLEESTADRFKCPVLAYVACFAYNVDDTFKTADKITSLLANWLFLLRCTALYRARSIGGRNGPSVLR